MAFNWKDETMLITGASSGLGRALAIKAGELGATVILIARNEERLSQVRDEIVRGGGCAYTFAFDLQNVFEIKEYYQQILKTVQKNTTILVNNVGYQVAGFVQNTPTEIFAQNYRVNTVAPVALIQCVLPDMLKQNKGVIANVMSSVMYHAFPGVSSYCASKKALGSIHESLKAELTGTAIRTLCIRPGGFRSSYWKNTEVGNRIKNYIRPNSDKAREPSIVADKICRAIEKGREDFDLSTFKDKVGYHLSYWAPTILDKINISKNSSLLKKRPNA